MDSKRHAMQSTFHLVLEVESSRHNMGRVRHLEVVRLDDAAAMGGITHGVRFWDGEKHRVLEGRVTEEDGGGSFCLDMGGGKKYRFRKLGT